MMYEPDYKNFFSARNLFPNVEVQIPSSYWPVEKI